MQLEAYLEQLRAGAVDSSAVFTLDPDKAALKRLNPRYPLLAVQAALASGAPEIRIRVHRDHLTMRWKPINWDARLADSVQQSGCQVRVGPETLDFRKGPRGWRPWRPAQFKEEKKLLLEHLSFAPVPLFLNERPLEGPGLQGLPGFAPPPAQSDGQRPYRWLYWHTDVSAPHMAVPFPGSAFLELNESIVALNGSDIVLHSLTAAPDIELSVVETLSPIHEAPGGGLLLGLQGDTAIKGEPPWLSAPHLSNLPRQFSLHMPGAGFAVAQEHRILWLRGYSRLPQAGHKLLGAGLLAVPLSQEEPSQIYVVDHGVVLGPRLVHNAGARFVAVVPRLDLALDIAGRNVIVDANFRARVDALQVQAARGCARVLPMLAHEGFGLSAEARHTLMNRFA